MDKYVEWLRAAIIDKGRLKEAAKLWVRAYEPRVDEGILAALPPGKKPKGAARVALMDRLNEFFATHNATPFLVPEHEGLDKLQFMPLEENVVENWGGLLRAVLAHSAGLNPFYRLCPTCGRTFIANKGTAVYCSVNCRVKAHGKLKAASNVAKMPIEK